jgi:hypothetical protein
MNSNLRSSLQNLVIAQNLNVQTLSCVVDTLDAWFSFLTVCITRTNWSYPLSFFLSTRAYSISPDHISRSQCDCLCHVTTTDPVAKPLMSHTGHKTHAQRRPYVDLMDVQCLHLPVAPEISSGQALDGLDFGLYVSHNFHSRGSLTVRQLRVPASVISATL